MIAIDLDFAQRFNKRDRECSQLTCHFLKQVDKNDLNFKNRKKISKKTASRNRIL